MSIQDKWLLKDSLVLDSMVISIKHFNFITNDLNDGL